MNSVLFSPLLMGFVATLLVLYLMTRDRKIIMRACVAIASFAFFGGLILYTIGYMPAGGGLNEALTAMLRGLFSTGRMFLINDDYGFLMGDTTKGWLVDNRIFKVAFWLFHVLALVVSISAVMGLFGHRLINMLRLRLRFYKTCTIICGNSDNALTLAENIATHDGERNRADPQRLVVYLAPSFNDELNEKLSAFSAIPLEYGKISFARQLRSAGLGFSPWRVKTCRVVLMPESQAEAVTQMRQIVQLASELSLPPERLSIHLLCENDWAWQHKQSTQFFGGTSWPIHVASETSLAARQMVLAQPPCGAIPFKNGVAQCDFSVLVLGFGKTGAQALRHLIMNGQFVGSTMRAVVVDREMENLQGIFEQTYPGFADCCETEYHALDVRSTAFFSLLGQVGSGINYVVLALNDDSQNLVIGQALSDYFSRNGWEQPCMALAMSTGEDQIEGTGQAVVFSRQSEIYSDSTVIHAKTDAMAMAVHYAYSQSSKSLQEKTPQQLWYEEGSFSQESSRASADFVPSILHLAGITQQQAAALETLTDSVQLAETIAQTEHLRWNAFHYAMGYTAMPIAVMKERFRSLRAEGARPIDCRKDFVKRQHVCLVPWEELATVSGALNALFEEAGLPERRDFQKEDFAIMRSIPRTIWEKDRQANEGEYNANS